MLQNRVYPLPILNRSNFENHYRFNFFRIHGKKIGDFFDVVAFTSILIYLYSPNFELRNFCLMNQAASICKGSNQPKNCLEMSSLKRNNRNLTYPVDGFIDNMGGYFELALSTEEADLNKIFCFFYNLNKKKTRLCIPGNSIIEVFQVIYYCYQMISIINELQAI